MYIGAIKERMNMTVTFTNEYSYMTYFAYTPQENFIYKFTDDDGNEIVWKTTKVLGKESEDENGYGVFEPVYKGDRIEIKATVKEHGTYKGTEQTVITRVKVLDIVEKAPTKEERQQARRDEQLASLEDGDDILYMGYKNYKEHYADCETLVGSWKGEDRTIGVIVRAGRLKKSGTRGKHYSGYRMRNENGNEITYYAISEETATKRANREHPNHTWECVKIFDYRR